MYNGDYLSLISVASSTSADLFFLFQTYRCNQRLSVGCKCICRLWDRISKRNQKWNEILYYKILHLTKQDSYTFLKVCEVLLEATADRLKMTPSTVGSSLYMRVTMSS